MAKVKGYTRKDGVKVKGYTRGTGRSTTKRKSVKKTPSYKTKSNRLKKHYGIKGKGTYVPSLSSKAIKFYNETRKKNKKAGI